MSFCLCKNNGLQEKTKGKKRVTTDSGAGELTELMVWDNLLDM